MTAMRTGVGRCSVRVMAQLVRRSRHRSCRFCRPATRRLSSPGRRCSARASHRRTPVTVLTFFVDGRQVCALTQPPFECEWDAGTAIAEHQIRAVGDADGRRPRSSRRCGPRASATPNRSTSTSCRSR